MIESLMLIAFGFLIATLFALIGAQFVWRRAVTVTLRKMAPYSAEAADDADDRQAELDGLLQRHERELAPMQAEIGNLRAENANLAAANDRLEEEMAQLSIDSDALYAEGERLRSALAALHERIGAATAETAKRAATVAAVSRELTGLEQALAAEARQYEAVGDAIAALETPATPVPERLKSHVPQALEPYRADEQDEDARALAEVKASLLAELDETPESTARDGEDEEYETPANGPSLAERIRALEAGVAH